MALTGILKVTPAQLNSYAATFGNSATEVQDLTRHMISTVCELCARWKGEASTMYHKKFHTLEDDMRRMFNMMKEHSEDLKQMAQNYAQAEDTNKGNFSGLAEDVIV